MTAAPHLPADARLSDWTAPDGWRHRRFDLPAAHPRGRLLFQGGRADVPEKYAETILHLRARGWSVTSFDWRGQGGSGRLGPDPRVGHADDFSRLVRDLAARFHIKGFEQSPIEREQAHQFLAALNDVKRRQHAETDKLQLESRTRNEEYNVKSRQLHTELEGHKQERRALRERVVSRITHGEAGYTTEVPFQRSRPCKGGSPGPSARSTPLVP